MLAGALAALLLAALPAYAGKLDNADCVACHPARDPVVFARLQAKGVAQPMGVSATEAVCRTCHNGTLVESRNDFGPRAFGHPTGVAGAKSSSGRFPVYSGKLECATCHTPHPENSTSLKRLGWLRAPLSEPFPCQECHQKMAEAKRSHLGQKVGEKALGEIKKRGGRTGAGGEIVCATCHTTHGAATRSLLVAPYGKDGETTLCRLCHQQKPDKVAHPVNTGVTHHAGEGFPLSDAGAITCSTCHPPHGVQDDKAAVGFRGPKDGIALCVPCHPEAKAGEHKHIGRELTARAKNDVTGLGGLVSSDNRVGCLTCHSGHGGAVQKLLVAPFKDGEPSGLCNTCHKVRPVTDKLAKGVSQRCTDCHGLHGREPNPSQPGQDPCVACHADRSGAGEHPAVGKTPCTGCHTMHKGDAKTTWLINPKEGDAGCRGCHDPARYGHATGVKPEKIDRALLDRRGIRLDGEGKVGCLTCHVSHAAKEGTLLGLSEEILCLYCHPGQNPFGPDGMKPGAHPVGVPLTQKQTEAIGAKTATGGKGEEERLARFSKLLACSSCHRAHGDKTVGRSRCESCHEERAGIASHGEQGGCSACHPVHSEKPPASTCAGCHRDKTETAHRETHKPAPATLRGVEKGRLIDGGGEIGCPTCHDPHSSSPKLLAKSDGTRVCQACHPDKASLLGGPHDVKEEDGTRGGCRSCHPVHAKRPDERPQSARCKDCHADDIVSAPIHSPEGSLGLWDRTSALPLFDNFGRRNGYGFVDCPTCHDVHKPAGTRAMRLSTGATPSLCLSCHPEKQSLLGSPHDASKGEGKSADAPCELCHSVHALGKMPPAWNLEAGAQGTLNDRKCSPCHGPPETGARPHGGPGSHPMNVPITENMNPKGLKLYTTTGGPMGHIVACSTCHNIHGELSESGERRAKFLRQPTGDGTLCAACHEPQKSVAQTQHDIPAPQKPLGPCSPCHVVHGGDPVGGAWGLKPFPEGLAQNRKCKTCHSRSTGMKSDEARLYYHMKDAEPAFNQRGTIYLQRPMLLWNDRATPTKDNRGITLFDNSGKPAKDGNLTCPSCHNPHQWSPESPTIKPNPNAKWTVTTKFMKFGDGFSASGSLCADCHKENTRSYIRRYHEVWSDIDRPRR